MQATEVVQPYISVCPITLTERKQTKEATKYLTVLELSLQDTAIVLCVSYFIAEHNFFRNNLVAPAELHTPQQQ